MEYVRKELRRKDAVYYSPELVGAEKLLFVPLVSKGLQLQGVMDCIIRTVKSEYILVEHKNMNSDRGKAYMDHKCQLVAYALLVEENFNLSHYATRKQQWNIIKLKISSMS